MLEDEINYLIEQSYLYSTYCYGARQWKKNTSWTHEATHTQKIPYIVISHINWKNYGQRVVIWYNELRILYTINEINQLKCWELYS